MFLRIVGDSFSRKPRQKVLMAGALALGMAVAPATLSVALDVGDRLAREFRSFGANLLVTPQADTLPLEVGGVDYRPVSEGAYLPEAGLGKLKTIFWRNNIIGFAPILETPADIWTPPVGEDDAPYVASKTTLIGTWSRERVASPDGGSFLTGIEKTNPWWSVEGRWFGTAANECVVGVNFARRARMRIGDIVATKKGSDIRRLTVTGLLTTGGPEDDAIVSPRARRRRAHPHARQRADVACDLRRSGRRGAGRRRDFGDHRARAAHRNRIDEGHRGGQGNGRRVFPGRAIFLGGDRRRNRLCRGHCAGAAGRRARVWRRSRAAPDPAAGDSGAGGRRGSGWKSCSASARRSA